MCPSKISPCYFGNIFLQISYDVLDSITALTRACILIIRMNKLNNGNFLYSFIYLFFLPIISEIVFKFDCVQLIHSMDLEI